MAPGIRPRRFPRDGGAFARDYGRMNLPRPIRAFLHRRGWIASPSLAFMGVPFGPEKRDLAAEVTPGVTFVGPEDRVAAHGKTPGLNLNQA